MILPDINLLICAYNAHMLQHPAAMRWWEATMNGDELIGLPQEVPLGFLRIATHPRLGAARVPLESAEETIRTWLSLPVCRVLLPTEGHALRVVDLMKRARLRGIGIGCLPGGLRDREPGKTLFQRCRFRPLSGTGLGQPSRLSPGRNACRKYEEFGIAPSSL